MAAIIANAGVHTSAMRTVVYGGMGGSVIPRIIVSLRTSSRCIKVEPLGHHDVAHRLRTAFSVRRNLRSLFCPPPGQVTHVDGLRAISVALVVIFHVFFIVYLTIGDRMIALQDEVHDPWYVNWAWKGEYGVDVFFVLSGYLIARHLFRLQAAGQMSTRRFYWRRFMRIYPVFAVCAAIYFIFDGPNREQLWANLLFVNNFREWSESAMEWTWSLCIEEQFYLIFPLFLAGVFANVRRRVCLLVGLIVGATLVRTYLVVHHELYIPIPLYDPAGAQVLHDFIGRLYIKPYARLGPILLGVLVAYLECSHANTVRAVLRRYPWSLGSAYVALCSASLVFLISVHNYQAGPPVGVTWSGSLWLIFARTLIGTTVAATIVMCGAGIGGPVTGVRIILQWRGWYPIAQLSYSTYLVHPMVIFVYCQNMSHSVSIWTYILAFPIVWSISLLVSAVLYLMVERPFMNLR